MTLAAVAEHEPAETDPRAALRQAHAAHGIAIEKWRAARNASANATRMSDDIEAALTDIVARQKEAQDTGAEALAKWAKSGGGGAPMRIAAADKLREERADAEMRLATARQALGQLKGEESAAQAAVESAADETKSAALAVLVGDVCRRADRLRAIEHEAALLRTQVTMAADVLSLLAQPPDWRWPQAKPRPLPAEVCRLIQAPPVADPEVNTPMYLLREPVGQAWRDAFGRLVADPEAKIELPTSHKPA